MLVAGDFLRREFDQREDGLRRAAFHPDTFNRLKYNPVGKVSITIEAADRPGVRLLRVLDQPRINLDLPVG
ncbi:MAG: hypothetical protein R6U98_02900 [Pirellulaceae bacterium]